MGFLLKLLVVAIPTLFVGFGSFGLLPTVVEIPLIDSYLVSGIGLFKSFYVNFPPFEAMMNAFLILIGWKMALKIVAMVPIAKGVLHK